MKKILFLFSIALLFSCSKNNEELFEHSGGSLKMALENQPSTYTPRQVTDYYSATVLYQIYEGLVSQDAKTLDIIPRIASEWSIANDGMKYSFTIRDDVKFHPHELFKSENDRLLTISDVVYSMELACSPNEDGSSPPSYSLIFKDLLKGANEFFDQTAKTISGITTKDNVITFELLHDDKHFLHKMANVYSSINSQKIITGGKEDEKVGTGPFIFSKLSSGDEPTLTLIRNVDYYGKDKNGKTLPYLDSVIFEIQSRKLEQLNMFEEKNLDMILGLPTSRISQMIEGRIQDFNSSPPKLVLSNNPLLISNFYYFNLNDDRFKDQLVRRAFNYAIDKESIGRDVLRNQYYDMGYYGIVPPISKALRGYDFKAVEDEGYKYNPEKAKKLLAEAGYPNGKGFGSVNLRYNINDVHSSVADEFAKQIFKVLNINVNIDGSSFEQLNKDGDIANGDIFKMGFAADFPSPESFLMNFYSPVIPSDSTEPSTINRARYSNYLFDEFFDKARNAKKMSDKMDFFTKAEIELMKDPPIIPLWYVGEIQITQSYVRNLHFNALSYFDFKEVYLKEWTEEEYKASKKTK